MNMDSYSMMHWVLVVLISVLPALIFSLVISKAGFSRWLAVMAAIPLVNLIFLWWFAFAEWPKFSKKS